VKKCLITGCEGFIGSHLVDLLLEKQLPIYAMVYDSTEKLDHVKNGITILECDLRKRERVEQIINDVKPNLVFHLAAQSLITVSWEHPEETLETNVMGTFYLLDALRKAGSDPVVEIVGSSSMYGPCQSSEMPLNENREFRPTSMYAVSKVTEEMLGYFYWRVYGMKVIIVRPFNMTGPRRSSDAPSDFAKGIAEIEKGITDVLKVGNLNTVRDFMDGRDAVKALWLLTEKGKFGEVYNLCSGKSYYMREFLAMLQSIANRKIIYEVVPEKMRPFDDPIYVGDNSKLRALGWTPEIPIEKTLADMLNYWRKQEVRLDGNVATLPEPVGRGNREKTHSRGELT